ncbi:S-layer homology domain-containing protein [Virgibacillus halodenitrificans]|uniref:S-layer homology domain-containing protein n=1 Tax=Virgibacillus halodenitrificans TaxID=1482 RepID=UPI001F2FA11F|nr:S-layer homology domain-containing protein [Virgibacillus halodenitrificans]MCG1027051.1 S-layer homology domain-containing protein [Virgibacillus halodenitrificans]
MTKQKKFAASTMAVAAATAAVAPTAVSADTVDFTDVDESNSHYEGVQWLASKGIQGYEDGSFGVTKELTRPHAAIMFTKALGLDLVDKSEVGNYFNDIEPNDLYADYIATTGKAEIFKGKNGDFLPGKELSREQMASTLVNAFDLKSNGDKADIYLGNVTDTHKENVQILADLGITNQFDDFRPTETVTRGQFATFLKLSYEVAEQQGNVVESVRPLSKTVDVNGTLEFAINGEKDATDLSALKDAGYDVEFKASENVFDGNSTSTTGKVTANAGDEFTYQVVISKDGEEVAKTDRTSVTVENYETTVTEISSVDVQLGNITSTSGVLATGDNASLTVKGKTKASGEEVVDLTDKVEFKSNKPAIATVDSNGTIMQQGAKGDVTFTVGSGDVTKEVTLNAGNEAREISSKNSSIDPASLAMGTGTTAKAMLILKDQYGDIVKDATISSDSDVVSTVEGTFNEETNGYDVTLTAGQAAASGGVVLNANGVEVASITTEVKEPGEVASYKLTAPKSTLDLNSNTTSTELTLSSLDAEGFTVNSDIAIDGTDFVARSSDESVATVQNGTVKAEGTGQAVITVYQKDGAFEDEVASYGVNVVDSTPTISTVTFSELENVEATNGEVDVSELVGEITAMDPEGNKVKATIAEEASEEGAQDNKLVIKDENGNEIGTLLAVTSADAKFTAGTTNLQFDPEMSSESETLNLAVLDIDRKIIDSKSVEVSIK